LMPWRSPVHDGHGVELVGQGRIHHRRCFGHWRRVGPKSTWTAGRGPSLREPRVSHSSDCVKCSPPQRDPRPSSGSAANPSAGPDPRSVPVLIPRTVVPVALVAGFTVVPVVIVATTRVPVSAPARIPLLARAPVVLGGRRGMGVCDGGRPRPSEPQTGGQGDCCCCDAHDLFHNRLLPTSDQTNPAQWQCFTPVMARRRSGQKRPQRPGHPPSQPVLLKAR
jgi:hypothetical protein